MMVGQKEKIKSNLTCGEVYANAARTESEETAQSLIAALSDEQLLKIMEEIAAHPAS